MSHPKPEMIDSETSQYKPYLSAQGLSVPAAYIGLMVGVEEDGETPKSVIVLMRSGALQVTRTLNSEEARSIAMAMLETADKIEAVTRSAAETALAKMTGGAA